MTDDPKADDCCSWPWVATRRGLRLATPSGRSIAPAEGRTIKRRDVLGGLIHEYRWAA